MEHRISESVINPLPFEFLLTANFLDNIANGESDNCSIAEYDIDENYIDNSIEDYKTVDGVKNYMKDSIYCHDNEKDVLVNAYRESCSSKQLTPLLKYELKCLIQARRVTQGMDEMQVQFLDPSAAKLSAAEQEQVERRRRQNRMAARKFRQKRKMSEEFLVTTIQELEKQNQQLQNEAQVLRREKQLLMEIVTDHLLHCPYLSHLSLEMLGGASVP